MTLSEFLGPEYVVKRRKKLSTSNLTEEYKGKSVLGVTLTMHNGMSATCIAERSSQDIDIRFEDGTVAKGKPKKNFLLGGIAHPGSSSSCLGQRVKMPCGLYATCIADNGWDNIDVQFEDGEILRGRTRREFRIGQIRHPSVYEAYVGQCVVTEDGVPCVCVSYRSSKDIDVELEDGSIRHGLSHNQLSGWATVKVGQTTSIVGESYLMSCGMRATCVADRGCYDVDVQFDDGTIVSGVARGNFRKGFVPHPDIARCTYPGHEDTCILGVRRRMNCGFWCTCIKYNNGHDITVQFDDGSIVEHRYQGEFTRRSILHPKLGSLSMSGDSIAQRLLYWYVTRFYKDAAYSIRPGFLKSSSGRNYELDIFIPSLGVGIEFDGPVAHHFDVGYAKAKNKVIEKASEVKRLFVVLDNDKRIVSCSSPKVTNIALRYSSRELRLDSVFTAAKMILTDLGNDVSKLELDWDVVAELYMKGVVICRNS